MITSNKSYLEWGKTFGDDVLATAILDRLLHYSVTFSIKGDSYRMEKKRKTGFFPFSLNYGKLDDLRCQCMASSSVLLST